MQLSCQGTGRAQQHLLRSAAPCLPAAVAVIVATVAVVAAVRLADCTVALVTVARWLQQYKCSVLHVAVAVVAAVGLAVLRKSSDGGSKCCRV
jgi:hypothetical protein